MLRQAFHLAGQLSLYLALGAASIGAATARLAGATVTFTTVALPFLCVLSARLRSGPGAGQAGPAEADGHEI